MKKLIFFIFLISCGKLTYKEFSFPNGRTLKYYIKNGKPHGSFELYQNNNLLQKGNFKEGLKEGFWYYYYSNKMDSVMYLKNKVSDERKVYFNNLNFRKNDIIEIENESYLSFKDPTSNSNFDSLLFLLKNNQNLKIEISTNRGIKDINNFFLIQSKQAKYIKEFLIKNEIDTTRFKIKINNDMYFKQMGWYPEKYSKYECRFTIKIISDEKK